MEEDEEPVASIAAAKPGVLVNAPAINPTTLGVSMSNKYLEAIPVSAAVATINNVIIAEISQFFRDNYPEMTEKQGDKNDRWHVQRYSFKINSSQYKT